MAKRGDPSVLRHVVIFLRSLTRMTQAQFGKVCRIAQPDVSLYEKGKKAPSEEVLRRMARVARVDWSLVVHLRNFYSSLLDAISRGSTAPSVEVLDRTILPPALLAVTPYLIEVRTVEPARPTPEEERHEAEQTWAVLEQHPIPFRRRLIEISPRSGSWALAVRVCEASVCRAAHDANESLELAELALSIAERVLGEESWRSRLKGYCWAHVANARRVANDLSGADEAFAQAWDLWRAGAASDPELLAEWRLFSLEASLRRAQRRFSKSLELLDQARARCGNDPRATGRILLTKEQALHLMGDPQGALAVLAEAAPFVEASRDARLLFSFRFKTVHNLSQLERHAEVAEMLPVVRELAVQQGNELDLIRVLWLEAKVAAGQGRPEEAIANLELVGRVFTTREMPYDAALSSLDLCMLWLKAGRTAEVQELALAMGWIFKAKGIGREALAALKLFCDAAQQEAATVELTRQVIAEIEKIRRSAPSLGEGRDRA